MNRTILIQKQVLMAALVAFVFVAFPAEAAANAGSVAGGVFSVVDDLIGWLEALAKPLMVLMIIIAGMTWAFTRNDEGMKTIGRVIIGLSIAIGGSAIAQQLGFFGATF